MNKGIEREVSTPVLAEIIVNSRQIASDLDPSSPSIKEAIERREEADQRLTLLGRPVILFTNPFLNS